LIYVTRFEAERAIEETLRQLDYRGMGEASDRVFHLKWQQLHHVVEELCQAEGDPYRRTLLCDMKRLLEHKRRDRTPNRAYRSKQLVRLGEDQDV